MLARISKIDVAAIIAQAIDYKSTCLAAMICLAIRMPSASAQIYNWQTNQVIPGTQGITPGPGIDLSNWNVPGHNLEYAHISNDGGPSLDLTGANFSNTWLDYAELDYDILDSVNLSGADLTGARLGESAVGANFSNAIITGAQLPSLTQAQFYSTASYRSKNLQGIGLGSPLSGWDLSDCDLTSATLGSITGANLTNATIANGTFYGSNVSAVLSETASYQSKDMHGVNLSSDDLAGWDLSGQNLTGARLGNITGVNLSGATITETIFNSSETLAQIYSTASYQNRDLHGVAFGNLSLTGADFHNQNLANAGIGGDLTGTDFSGANLTGVELPTSISGANLTNALISKIRMVTWAMTASQLYSTASYAAKDLDGMNITNGSMASYDLSGQNLTNLMAAGTDFTNANLAGANLTNCTFQWAPVTGADFTGAILNNTSIFTNTFTAAQLYSTASYQSHVLDVQLAYMGIGLDMSGWNFAGQNLTDSWLQATSFAGADFSGAIIADVQFDGGLSSAQLYSAESYQTKDLHEIGLNGPMQGWNFDGQNLYRAYLIGDLTNATFRGANLAGAEFYEATLTGVDFTGASLVGVALYSTSWNDANFTNADVRGTYVSTYYLNEPGIVHRNTIANDGRIQGLALLPGDQLTIHNYSVPISVLTSMTLATGSTLEFDFDSSAWQSTVTTPAGVVPQLGGDLSLAFIPGVDPTTLIGTGYQLFDWSESPTGTFDQITDALPAGLYWDLSDLYTAGTITLLPEPGSAIMALAASGLILRRRRMG